MQSSIGPFSDEIPLKRGKCSEDMENGFPATGRGMPEGFVVAEAHLYEDVNVSAFKQVRRPEFDWLLEDLEPACSSA